MTVSLFPGLGCLSMVLRSLRGAVVGSGWVLGSIKVLPLRYAILRVNSGVISEALRPRYDHAFTSLPLLAQRHHQCNKVWKEAFIPDDEPHHLRWRSVFRMRMERASSSKQPLWKRRKETQAMARRPNSVSKKKDRENIYGIDHCQAHSLLAKSSDQANMQPKLQRRRRLHMTRSSISIFNFVET